MGWGGLIRRIAHVAAAGFTATALAGPPGAGELPLERLEPKALLARIYDAVATGSYAGTLVSTAGGAVHSSRVVHFGEGSQQYERVEMLDGQARLVYRHNDVVHTLWPTQRVAVVEHRDRDNALPSLLRARPDPGLFERYELKAEGFDRIAGHEAAVFVLRPRDDARFAQRLWAERRSALLLRTDVLAPDGRVLESAAFTDVTIGVRPQPDSVLRPMKRLEGYRVLSPSLAPTALEAEGWQLVPVAGFRQVSCVRRSVGDGTDATVSGHEPVVQAVFSDGLTHVSVFIEPYREGHHRPGKTAIGATHTLMKRHDQWWVTVMGDVPMATVARFAEALERRR
jgi:sigma-E factor negative regulatory protein RseB